MKKVKLVKCAHCQTLCDASENYCYGCGHVVCVDCIFKHGHMGDGAHGGLKEKKTA